MATMPGTSGVTSFFDTFHNQHLVDLHVGSRKACLVEEYSQPQTAKHLAQAPCSRSCLSPAGSPRSNSGCAVDLCKTVQIASFLKKTLIQIYRIRSVTSIDRFFLYQFYGLQTQAPLAAEWSLCLPIVRTQVCPERWHLLAFALGLTYQILPVLNLP